ncbi:hypothetical protein [Advenella mimigardefordensis]|uniref:Putative membrane protein n=1 Tax=Advenella mimigardefordensis (strain DSM 17166 / LMG 22922 / DPN7) TaxID=1247726 RepID=W0PCF3_ADVMD|nr:hypothetical protein [Advenella mimigardefordensis]AHG63172.1 putative membrane protein [Advenella mimigardefordensis DPN7]
MALLLVLLILVLGYRHCTAIPAQKSILKRSSGWESYVLLGNHGLGGLWLGFVTFIVLVPAIYGAMIIFSLVIAIFGIEARPVTALTQFLWYKQIAGIDVWVIAVGIFSILMGPQKIKQDLSKDSNKNWTDELRKQDAISDIVIYASSEVKPVKISLKSRKVYVGLIDREQFERIDSDNIVIIPYLSGHREKDSLKVEFDSNYIDVYQKNKIEHFNTSGEPSNAKLADFRCVIRLNEVESISLFDLQYYQDFRPDE